MICRCCGIEFDTMGVSGDTVRCPQCGTMYRRKAQDPRAGLNVPIFIPKGQAAIPPEPVRQAAIPSGPAAVPAAIPVNRPMQAQAGNAVRNGYPSQGVRQAPARPVGSSRKKTHHVRTALLLTLLLLIAVTVLALTGLGDIFPRATDETSAPETQTEAPAEDPEDEGVLEDVKGITVEVRYHEEVGRYCRGADGALCMFSLPG